MNSERSFTSMCFVQDDRLLRVSSLRCVPPRKTGIRIALAGVLLGALSHVACRQDMHDQPKYKAQRESDFYADGRSVRPQIPGTVARGQLRDDELMYTGKINGELSTLLPMPLTREMLERGRNRYNIFCTPCHDRLGTGQGMIVRRGLRQPPSFHIDRLREVPAGHFFDVMTNGFGAMYDYAARIDPRDRWAIVAYIRALQLSRQVKAADVPPEILRNLQKGK
jgi:hypothetical protein